MAERGDPSNPHSSWLSQPDRLTEQELGVLVREHQDNLLRFAYRKLGNVDDAREAVSDALIKLWKATRPREPASYLWTVLRTCCTDVIRKRIRERKHPTSALQENTEAVATDPSGLDAAEQREEERVHERLEDDCKDRVLAASSARDRSIVMLKTQGLTQKAIAEQFGVAQSRITQIIDAMVAAFIDCIHERYADAAKE